MTFVGKILVILIMAFSLVFLGVSTVVFTTATSWKAKATSLNEQLTKAQTKARDSEQLSKEADDKLKAATAEHAKLIADRENQIKALDNKVSDAEGQMTQSRSQLETAQKNAQVALAEATARKGETDVLNQTLDKAQAQANQFNAQNLELTDRIRVLEREKATAEQNAKDLRASTLRMSALIQSLGVSPDSAASFDPDSVPPPIDGRVTQVDRNNRSVEITIGSNDGLKNGHELYLFRREPAPKFLGKVKVVSLYPNKAVADVVGGRTNNGLRIQEGDLVASSLNSR